jgi:nickel-dependent lactate racemase
MDPVILPYGDSQIQVPFAGEIPACDFPDPLPDISGAVEQALDEPEGSRALSEMIPVSGRIAVLVSDLTRGTTAATVLIPALEYLENRGAGPERTTIYIASGMHRGQSCGEIEAQLGSRVAGRYRIIQHDARDAGSLLDAGTTSSGTRCLFNREAAMSSLIVGVGAVSFHYFAGFGGGRKLILPGISGEETIIANHRRSLKKDPAEGLSDGCRPGNLDGNPVHEDMIEGASLVPAPVFMINAVAGAGGEPAFVNAGDIDLSHRIAAARLLEKFTLRAGVRRPAVVASAGGYPKDINLLQAHKAIRHASMAVENGGLLLMAAACGEGVGSDSLEDDFSGGREKVPSRVSRRYTLNSQASMSIFDITDRIEVRLLSGLPDDIIEKFGFGTWRVEDTASMLDIMRAGEPLFIPHAAAFLPVI